MYKTRKLIFTALAAILICLLFTCIPFGPPDDYEDYEDIYTDVEYSQDGSSLTIYLDGSAPVRQSRALTKALAILGHDLFEVAFAYKNSSGQIAVARAVWETGHAAGIKGVYREGAGVDYSNVRRVSSMPNNSGSAILFVGKKSDRTLLAVGKLAQVDGIGSPGDVPPITKDTKTITFEVAALRAGVNATASSSSFTTDAKAAAPGETVWTGISADNTDVYNVLIGQKPFPLFSLPAANGRWMHGAYKFQVVTGATDFDLIYSNGIIQKTPVPALTGGDPVVRYPTAAVGNPPVNYNRIPRYPVGNNRYETVLNSMIVEYEGVDQNNPSPHNGTTAGTRVRSARGAAVPYAAAAGDPFDNELRFLIGPAVIGPSVNMEGYVFAFSFEIPVYPLTGLDERGNEFSWYLRPGYDSYRDDLDDGMGGTGGAILIGTGVFQQTANYSLYLYKRPDKTKYNGQGGTNAWNFSLDGIDLWVIMGTTNAQADLNHAYFVIENARRTIGGPRQGNIALKEDGDIQTLLAANHVDGVVTIRIEYYGAPAFDMDGSPPPYIDTSPVNGSYKVPNPLYSAGPTPYFTEFIIYYFELPAGVDFNVPDNHRTTVSNNEDFMRLQNDMINASTTGGTFLVAFFKSYDISSVVLKANLPFTIVIIAGAPDVIIGMSGVGGNSAFQNSGVINNFFIGVWPFDEILSVQGKAFDTHPFYINPGGSYRQVPLGPDGKPSGVAPPQGTGYFISGGGTARNNVSTSGVTIFNRTTRLIEP